MHPIVKAVQTPKANLIIQGVELRHPKTHVDLVGALDRICVGHNWGCAPKGMCLVDKLLELYCVLCCV